MPTRKTPGPGGGAEPNHFVLSGWGVEITYDTTSISGQPLLSYQGRQFTGKQITETKLPIGRLATVTLDEGATDGPIVHLSLLVPSVVPAAGPTEITALALRTTTRRVATGQRQSYSVLALEGTAETVLSVA
jgi:hypothetical protein